ncbi:MAG: type II toxin-antitoxin system prevent-host-death family antitoxin [Cephaloticoccus sp.]|nr:type II toxin-antitoxin system prevent-host-death family antitoxin [Cephaloticoccus sp.]MCF7759566.1 type II toxin-antitoxin system prevent-host-death family antitoxin [Cephaloticoccus sp.]
MKTKWIASREFSANPGRALKAVSQSGRVLVTSNGKPKAIMIPTSEDTFSQDLAMLDRASLGQAVAAIRAHSVRQGIDRLTAKDIDAEIQTIRAARKLR